MDVGRVPSLAVRVERRARETSVARGWRTSPCANETLSAAVDDAEERQGKKFDQSLLQTAQEAKTEVRHHAEKLVKDLNIQSSTFIGSLTRVLSDQTQLIREIAAETDVSPPLAEAFIKHLVAELQLWVEQTERSDLYGTVVKLIRGTICWGTKHIDSDRVDSEIISRLRGLLEQVAGCPRIAERFDLETHMQPIRGWIS